MLEFTKLELRKSRLVALGIGLALAASLIFPVPLTWFMPLSLSDLWGAALLFWTVAGVPLAALIVATTLGASLRADIESGVEAALPLSPRKRLGGALLAAAAWTGALACGVVLLGLCCDAWRESLLSFAALLGPVDMSTFERAIGLHEVWFGSLSKPFLLEAFEDWHAHPLGPAAVMWASATAILLTAGLSSAWAFGGAVLGALLALLAAACGAGAPAVGLWVQMFEGARSLFWAPILGPCVFSAAGAAAAAWALAPCLELRRRPEGKRLAVLAAGALSPLLLGSYAIWRPYQLALGHLEFLYREDAYAIIPSSPLSSRRVPVGALARDKAGNVWWYSPKAGRALLLAGHYPIGKRRNDDLAAAWDESGELWLLRHDGPEAFELFTGSLDGPLPLRSRFLLHNYVQFSWRGATLGLASSLRRQGHWYPLWAPLPVGDSPRWSEYDQHWDSNWGAWEDDAAFQAGLSARFSRDQRALIYRGGGQELSCSLPAPAAKEPDPMYAAFPRQNHLAVPPPRSFWRADGSLLFLAAVRTRQGEGIAACGPDGKARLLWNDVESSRPESSPDGALVFRSNDEALLILDSSGTPLPPLPLSRANDGFNTVVHVADGRVWLRQEHALMRVVDAKSGAEVWHWTLPKVDLGVDTFLEKEIEDAREGEFILTGRRLYFVDWAGNRKDLGPA